jgi:hypothetical protein
VWKALERGQDVETIVANVACETGQQIEGVRKDMQDFIDALRKLNLATSLKTHSGGILKTDEHLCNNMQ